MNRTPALFALLFLLASPVAAAEYRVGGDLGVLLLEEGAGDRNVLPMIQPRVSLELLDRVRASALYAFTYAPGTGASTVDVTTFHHRLGLRAEYAHPLRLAAVVLATGPALAISRTTIEGSGSPVVSTTATRLALSAGLLLDVQVGEATSLRMGCETFWTARRLDLAAVLGVSVALGGSR